MLVDPCDREIKKKSKIKYIYSNLHKQWQVYKLYTEQDSMVQQVCGADNCP